MGEDGRIKFVHDTARRPYSLSPLGMKLNNTGIMGCHGTTPGL
ncbi:hypothetical protein BV133_2860 [Blastochloris viridis]|uniref:Uncharacterized protein n=1 Tax=Blastochloris viridis TaxID=1079 RepID=A0A182D5K9_BLAVI|nr:hypothetical protein BV133_2860 [Blastochloris viridis]